jgi:hypothetical protein
MNTQNHDDLERLLGLELHDRAGDVHGTPLGLADVKGRAGRIRRNRRIAGGVVAAAVFALAVPVGLNIADAVRPDSSPPVMPSPDVPHEVSRTTLTMDGLERGDSPGIEYFTADGVVLPGEGLQELDQSLQALVESPADGGWAALGPAADELLYLQQDFSPNGSDPAYGLVTNPDRTRFAVAMPTGDGETLVARSTTDRSDGMTWDFPKPSWVEPIGFLDDNRVVYFARTLDNPRQFGIAEPDGSLTELPDRPEWISASPDNGLIALQTGANEDASGCFGVVDPDASLTEPVWETCDYSLGAFSPDGRFVLASSSYQSGAGPVSMAVLDAATGRLVASFDQTRDTQITLWAAAWETTDTVIVLANEGLTNTLLRLGVDGTLEETIEPVEGDPLGDLPLYLGADRLLGWY